METLCCFLWLSKQQPNGESGEAELKGTSASDCTARLAHGQDSPQQLQRLPGVHKAALASQEAKVTVEQEKDEELGGGNE